MLPIFAERLENGRVRILIANRIEPVVDSDGLVNAVATTQQCIDAVCRHIERRPELWLWIHRRFR